ncbi:hypothetical protein SLEP1_g40160 [Rubroshorea leprosula]|uniref:Phylloplanin n=1 Tax=Rubroshorea leprosula TaxID=152421 RepID=A0AAV5L2X7_9ROSI|nr:hypothetical protein SLEP1_g40160 [Rubroshorea leprosula]
MAFKTLFFASLLLAAIASPMADAQSPGGLIGTLLDAGVQLRCGGNVVADATTNEKGAFSMVLDPLQFVLSSVLSNCSLAVTTPLSTCNAKLPSVGCLLSSLQLAGNTLIGLFNVADIILQDSSSCHPSNYTFMASRESYISSSC